MFAMMSSAVEIMIDRCNWNLLLPHLAAQPGAETALAGNERGPSGGATLLPVPISEERALFREWVDVRRLVAHHALIVRADIPIPDVVTPDDEDVGFLRLRERACSRNSKGNDDKPHNSCFDFHKFELVCYLWLGRVTH